MLHERSWAKKSLWLMILIYALYFSYLTLVRYHAFESRALDMGNMDQAIWNTMEGRWFHLTNQEGTVNRLSLHVEPILVPISWLYHIYSGPETLLVLQAVVVALGALPLYGLTRYKLKNEWLALVIALLFLLNPSIQGANWLEFHPVTLAPTFLMAAFYMLVTGRLGWYTLFAILAASCKEEIALILCMMGLYGWWILRRPKVGIATILLSVAWAGLAVFVIQDHFGGGNIHWGRYDYLGDGPLQMVQTLLTRPDIILQQLQSADALNYGIRFLWPTLFIALLAPEILLLALPSLGINLLADFSPMHQVDGLVYSAPIVPFVMMATVVGVQRLRRILAQTLPARTKNRPGVNGEERGITHLGITDWFIGGAIFACSLLDQHWYGYTAFGNNYRHLVVTEHHRRTATIIAQIPPDAKVSAQDRLDPHVSQRETVYIFPRLDDPKIGRADTIFVDVTGSAWPQHPNDLRNTINELLADDFGIAAADDGYLLLRADSTRRAFPDSFYDAWRRPDFTAESSPQIVFENGLRLLHYEVTTDSHHELITKLYWQAEEALPDGVRFYIAYLDPEWNLLHDTIFYPPTATLWYPTSMWKPDVPVLVQTLPWSLDVERFVLALGVYEGEDGWKTGQRVPVAMADSVLPIVEDNHLIRLGGYTRVGQDRWNAISQEHDLPAALLDASFHGKSGEQIVLEGATVPTTQAKPGGELPFTLHWHTTKLLALDYTLFAHLLNSMGEKVAQLDWQPNDGISRLPTSAWVVDQTVVDTQMLTLPESLHPGNYRLIVGLYHWQDGQRLIVAGADTEPGDVATVAHITVD